LGDIADRIQFTHSMHAEITQEKIVIAAIQNDQLGLDKGYKRSIRIITIDLKDYGKPVTQ